MILKNYLIHKNIFIIFLLISVYIFLNVSFSNLKTFDIESLLILINLVIGHILMLVFFVYIVKKYTYKFVLYSLVVPFFLGYWWTYYINPLLFVFFMDYNFSFRIGYDYSSLSYLTKSTVLKLSLYSNIGLFAFFIGFFISKSNNYKVVFKRYVYNKYILYLIGISSFLSVIAYVYQFGGIAEYFLNIMAIRAGKFSDETQYPLLRHMMLTFQVFALLWIIYTLNKKNQFTWQITLMIFLSTLVLLLTGGRGALITNILTIIFVISIYIKVEKKYFIFLIVFILLILFAYRSILFYLQNDTDLVYGSEFNILYMINEVFLKNPNYDQSLLVFGDYRNNVPLLLLSPIKDTILTFWPESLIPIGKYDEPRFTYLITELLSDRKLEDTMTPGLLGLCYLMFREFGIVVVMFLLGYIIKKSMYIYNILKNDNFILLLYSILYFTMIGFASSGSIEANIKSYIIKILLFLISYKLLFKKKRVISS